MTLADRASVVKYILADVDNHQMMVDACSYFDVDANGTLTTRFFYSLCLILVDHVGDENEQIHVEPVEEEEMEDSDPEEIEFLSCDSLNDHLHSKLGHDDVIPSFTELDDVEAALELVEEWIELKRNADYSLLAQIQQMWVDKLKIFLADESTLDEEVMDLDDGPVEFGTAVPVIQIAVNPQPNHPTPAVPPVKQRIMGLSRRALASRPVN